MICRPHHITRQSPDIYNSMTICAQFVKFHAEDSVGEIFYRYFSKSQIIDCQLGVTLWTKDVGISQCSPSPLLSVVNSVLTGDLTVHQTAFRLLHHSVFLQGKCGATFSSTYASELLSHQTCLYIWLPEHHARRFTYASGLLSHQTCLCIWLPEHHDSQVHIHLCPFKGNVQCLQEAGSEAAREQKDW